MVARRILRPHYVFQTRFGCYNKSSAATAPSRMSQFWFTFVFGLLAHVTLSLPSLAYCFSIFTSPSPLACLSSSPSILSSLLPSAGVSTDLLFSPTPPSLPVENQSAYPCVCVVPDRVTVRTLGWAMKARPEPGCKAPLATTNVFRHGPNLTHHTCTCTHTHQLFDTVTAAR